MVLNSLNARPFLVGHQRFNAFHVAVSANDNNVRIGLYNRFKRNLHQVFAFINGVYTARLFNPFIHDGRFAVDGKFLQVSNVKNLRLILFLQLVRFRGNAVEVGVKQLCPFLRACFRFATKHIAGKKNALAHSFKILEFAVHSH